MQSASTFTNSEKIYTPENVDGRNRVSMIMRVERKRARYVVWKGMTERLIRIMFSNMTLSTT